MRNLMLRNLACCRFCYQKRSLAVLTPQEAGRQAHEMAKKTCNEANRNKLHLKSVLSHAGVADDDSGYQNLAMSPPLHMATTYTRPPSGKYNEGDSIYIREDNPTRLLLEKTMFLLETHGADPSTIQECSSLAFSSGMMAASSIILSHQTPLHVVLPTDLYHGVSTVLKEVFTRFGVTVEHVDVANDSSSVRKAVEANIGQKEVIVWIETPSNPLCHVTDIAATCKSLQEHNVTIVVDSTLAPPVTTQPLKLGADVVMHSATKYLGGHSDVLCGIVTASPWTNKGRELFPKLKKTQTYVGGVASTLDSWLTLRGLRTLATRFEQQSSTAFQLATYLNEHPSVHKVYYPGIRNSRNMLQFDIAMHQMTKDSKALFGGILSVEMESESKAYALAGALQTIHRATSLGGTETLIEHRHSIEPPSRQTSPKGLLRISVGLEDPMDLIDDLANALRIVDEIHTNC